MTLDCLMKSLELFKNLKLLVLSCLYVSINPTDLILNMRLLRFMGVFPRYFSSGKMIETNFFFVQIG
jgi:hypothetical protein